MRIIGKVPKSKLNSAVVKAADAFSYIGKETVVTSVMVGDVEYAAAISREEYIMRRTRQRSRPVIVDSFNYGAF